MSIEKGVMMQYFEWYLPENSGLWNQLRDNASSLAKNGISAVWMPPAYKGQAGAADVGYGVYDIYDLGEFDQKGSVATKYGTREEYLAAIEELHKNGIQVYADIVLDHMIGADIRETVVASESAEYDRNQQVSDEYKIKAWTKFTFPGRKGKYSDFVWDASCFSGVDWDDKKHRKAIFNFKGDDWSENTDHENGNADYLMGANINFSNPEVVNHLKEWGQWYIDTTNLDGFRLDAVKHIDSEFYPDWLATLRKNNHREYFSVGEYWNGDVNVLKEYLKAVDGCMSLFDTPLHFNFHHASTSNGTFDMSKLLDNTLMKDDPEHAVTFVDNHDTQPGQALESTVAEWFVPLAYTTILLRTQGYPCIFYGDYYGLEAREGRNFQETINRLLKIRKNNLFGEQHDYFDHQYVVGWTYTGDAEHKNSGVAVIMSDNAAGQKTMYVGVEHKGEIWKEALGDYEAEVRIDDNGNGIFYCDGGSVSVWVPAASLK